MNQQPGRPQMNLQQMIERDMYVAHKSVTPTSAEVQFGTHRIFVKFLDDGRPLIKEVIPNRVLNTVERDAAVAQARASIAARFGGEGGVDAPTN